MNPGRRGWKFSRGTRGVSLGLALLFLWIFVLPNELLAQTYNGFQNKSADRMEQYGSRATRLENEEAWNNYLDLGIASEKARWEQEAYEQLQEEISTIEEKVRDASLSKEAEQAEKEAEITEARGRYEAAAAAWDQEADDFVDAERGRFLADRTAVKVGEVAVGDYEAIIAQAEAAVSGSAALDLDAWESAIQPDHIALKNAFEQELTDELVRARSEISDLSPVELQAFENRLDEIEQDVRLKFEGRDNFYIKRARNRYIALKRGDDLNARLAAEEESADAVTGEIIARTRAELETETEDMMALAIAQTENLAAGASDPDFDPGLNWESQMEAVIDSGLRAWERAEEDLYARRLVWLQEAERSREEGRRIWQQNHDQLKAARDEWLDDIQVQISAGREQWQNKLAEFRQNREAAEQELVAYIQSERERWDASSQELGNIVNGGGASLLEAKDAYNYYSSLMEAVGPGAPPGSRDEELYRFYERQRNEMGSAVRSFQRILGTTNTVLHDAMNSGEDHTGLLNDVRDFAGTLPETLEAIPVVASDGKVYEDALKEAMAATDENFVLYRRDIEDLTLANALFVKRAEDLQASANFDYAAAADLDEMTSLVLAVDRKYDKHREELTRILNEEREGEDDATRLASIKTDIAAWFADSTDQNARLKKQVRDYFNSRLGGVYETAREGDPYLMTTAEYEWELLRRKRNHLMKKMRRVEAVKEYADRAFQHDAGLEMAAVTRERAGIAKVHSDLAEISYMLIRGDIQALDGLDLNDPAILDAEVGRILSERGIDRAALGDRRRTLTAELGALDSVLGSVTPPASGAGVSALIGTLDAYLNTELALEERAEHPLGLVRTKLIAYRDRVDAGAGADERDERWTAIHGGATALRDEIQELFDDYNFNGADGLNAHITRLGAQLREKTIGDIRGELDEIKTRVTANAEVLAAAREELDAAREAYRQARIDFDILKQANSEDLIRQDLINTTGQLGAILNRMSRLEDIPGFDGVYDAAEAERITYLNDISQRQSATDDLNESRTALVLVQGLEASKLRLNAFENLLSAAPAGGSPSELADAGDFAGLADFFINAQADLIDTTSSDEHRRSWSTASNQIALLAQYKNDLIQAEDELATAIAGGDDTATELARAKIAATQENIRLSAEKLIAGLRGEETARRQVLEYYLETGSIDPEALGEQSGQETRTIQDQARELGAAAAERLYEFLQNEHRDGGGDLRDFSSILRFLNDRLADTATLPRNLRDPAGFGDAAGRLHTERMEWALVRDWLVQHQPAIDAAGEDPDSYDVRTPDEKWSDLLEMVGHLAESGRERRDFAATVPASASDPWVTAYAASRQAALDNWQAMLATGDAGLAAALGSLSSDDRELLAVYGADPGLADVAYLRRSLEAAARGLELELAGLNIGKNYEAAFRREKAREYAELAANAEQNLLPIATRLGELRGEKNEHRVRVQVLSERRDASADAGEIATLNARIAELNTRVTFLEGEIAALEPTEESLSDSLREYRALGREAAGQAASNPLINEALATMQLGLQEASYLAEAVKGMTPEMRRREQAVGDLTEVERVKVLIGMFETDERGEVRRDAGDNPIISAEFAALGFADPAADLGTLFAGPMRGSDLQRWADRLSLALADEEQSREMSPELRAAIELMENALRETQLAEEMINRRYDTGGSFVTRAKTDKEEYRERLLKLGQVMDLQRILTEAVNGAAQAGGDPSSAALAILENPEYSDRLRLFAGYDVAGEFDGVVDPAVQDRIQELVKLTADLRDARLRETVSRAAAGYAAMMADYASRARGDDTIIPPTRAGYLDGFDALDADTSIAAITAIAGDDGFRAGLKQWTADAPAEQAIFRGRMLELLYSSVLEGQDLKDAALLALADLKTEITDELEPFFDATDLTAERDANAVVTTTVANFITAYAARAGTAKSIYIPAIDAIDDSTDLDATRTALRDALELLADGENDAATAGIRRDLRKMIANADALPDPDATPPAAATTAELKTQLRDYVSTLTAPDAADVARLESELYVTELSRAVGAFHAASDFDGEEYPGELHEFLLVQGYQDAARQWQDYQDRRAAPTETERAAAVLDMSGFNAAIANSFVVADFDAFTAASTPVSFIAGRKGEERRASMAEYLNEYMQDRNTAAHLLPGEGREIQERAALAEYQRLQSAIAAGGIASINEHDYFTEFQDYILLLKAEDFMTRTGRVVTGATLEDRRASFDGHFEALLNDATYELGGENLGQRLLRQAERDRFYGVFFGVLEEGAPDVGFLPNQLLSARLENRLDDPLKAAADFLPEELASYPGYATADGRAILQGVHADYHAAFARLQTMQAAGVEDLAWMDDADLSDVVDRAGYAGAPAALRTDLIEMLRQQALVARGRSGSEAGAAAALRSRNVLTHYYASEADREALEEFMATEGAYATIIQEKFFSELANSSSELRVAAKEERGAFILAVMERGRGGGSAYYSGLSADLRTELEGLATRLHTGADAWNADEVAALRAEPAAFERYFDFVSSQELVTAGVLEEAESHLLTHFTRQSDAGLAGVAADNETEVLRALLETVHVDSGQRPAISAGSQAFLDAHPGLQAALDAAADRLGAELRTTIEDEKFLLDRHLSLFEEDADERREIAALLADPALVNPDARLGADYMTGRANALARSDEARATNALLATIQSGGDYFDQVAREYQKQAYLAQELEKFGRLAPQNGDYKTARFASYRSYAGMEKQYQSNNMDEYTKRGQVIEKISLAAHTGDPSYDDPETLLNGADWKDKLVSDDPARFDSERNPDDETIHIRKVFSVSSNEARARFGTGAAAEQAELRSTYFEHLANNYLESISGLADALRALGTAADFADARIAAGQGDIKAAVQANYDPAAASNDMTAMDGINIDARSRLATHSLNKIQESQQKLGQYREGRNKAGEDYARAARRNQIRTMNLVGYLRDVYYAIEGEMYAARDRYNAYSDEAENLRREFDNKNAELSGALSEQARRWRELEERVDEYDLRSQVNEYARTPYLFASEADSNGDEESELIEEYRGDAKEEYEMVRQAVDYLNRQMKEAAYRVYTQDNLDEFNAIVAQLDAGATFATLDADDAERLLELRDKKFNAYETLSAAEEAELTALSRREMYNRYQELITTRAEHIKHTMRMVRLHKANELIEAEIMRRRMIADEKKKQFERVLGSNFGNFDMDANRDAYDARNAVYARLAGIVEGGGNFFNEFRSWYWRGEQWAGDAYSSYTGAGMAQLKLAPSPQFWPTQIMQAVAGVAGANSINNRDKAAIGKWMGYGGALSEFSRFQGVYYQSLVAMGVRDMKLLEYNITTAIWTPVKISGFGMIAAGMAMTFFGGGLIAMGQAAVRQSEFMIQKALMEYTIANLMMWILYYNANQTAKKSSTIEVMNAQREYEDAQAAVNYFTKIPDQKTLKERMIQYGAQNADDPLDNSGEAKYKLTEEDLIYIFDQNEAGDPQYLNSDGTTANPTAEQISESLDITGEREPTRFHDSFGRRYDPGTITNAKPGELEGGYYWRGDERWTRLRTFNHNGSTQYEYARIIDENASEDIVYNMSEVLQVAVPHGQAIRQDRRAKYHAAGNAAASASGDTTFILNERDNVFEHLFNQAAGHREGGMEFTGYRRTYEDYRQNSDTVYQTALGQRQNTQLKEWELRERALQEQYQSWEARVNTILDRGRKSWANAENRFLQDWRDWERECEKNIRDGQKEWDDKIKDHNTKKVEWENKVRAESSAATIETVLTEAVQSMNSQLAAAERNLGMKLDRIDLVAAIEEAKADMFRTMPTGGEKLKRINANIEKFNTMVSIAKLSGTADWRKDLTRPNGSGVATRSGFADGLMAGGGGLGLGAQFRKQMKSHQKNIKVLTNVKIFEQYRQMMADFAIAYDRQNQQIEDQTTAAALSQGYVRVGDKFIKQGAMSNAYGVVDAYTWFDTKSALNEEMANAGFAPKQGGDLVNFLENYSDAEVDAYFYTQKLALQLAMTAIQGTDPTAASRDAKVIGRFNAWVGKPGGGNDSMALTHAGNHHHRNSTRDMDPNDPRSRGRAQAIQYATAGFGELGSVGRRPGGAPFGFFVQLQWMGDWVAERDAAGLQAHQDRYELDPISNLYNSINPITAIAQAETNARIGSQVHGRSSSLIWEANLLNTLKQPIIAAGGIAVGVGTGIAAAAGWTGVGAAIGGAVAGVGALAVMLGNSIKADTQTGERAVKMTDRDAINSAITIGLAAFTGGMTGGAESTGATVAQQAGEQAATQTAQQAARQAGQQIGQQAATQAANQVSQELSWATAKTLITQQLSLQAAPSSLGWAAARSAGTSFISGGFQYREDGSVHGWDSSGLAGDNNLANAALAGLGSYAAGAAAGAAGGSMGAFGGSLMSSTIGHGVTLGGEYAKRQIWGRDRSIYDVISQPDFARTFGMYADAGVAAGHAGLKRSAVESRLAKELWSLDARDKHQRQQIIQAFQAMGIRDEDMLADYLEKNQKAHQGFEDYNKSDWNRQKAASYANGVMDVALGKNIKQGDATYQKIQRLIVEGDYSQAQLDRILTKAFGIDISKLDHAKVAQRAGLHLSAGRDYDANERSKTYSSNAGGKRSYIPGVDGPWRNMAPTASQLTWLNIRGASAGSSVSSGVFDPIHQRYVDTTREVYENQAARYQAIGMDMYEGGRAMLAGMESSGNALHMAFVRNEIARANFMQAYRQVTGPQYTPLKQPNMTHDPSIAIRQAQKEALERNAWGRIAAGAAETTGGLMMTFGTGATIAGLVVGLGVTGHGVYMMGSGAHQLVWGQYSNTPLQELAWQTGFGEYHDSAGTADNAIGIAGTAYATAGIGSIFSATPVTMGSVLTTAGYGAATGAMTNMVVQGGQDLYFHGEIADGYFRNTLDAAISGAKFGSFMTPFSGLGRSGTSNLSRALLGGTGAVTYNSIEQKLATGKIDPAQAAIVGILAGLGTYTSSAASRTLGFRPDPVTGGSGSRIWDSRWNSYMPDRTNRGWYGENTAGQIFLGPSTAISIGMKTYNDNFR